jgi:hypothetical protein
MEKQFKSILMLLLFTTKSVWVFCQVGYNTNTLPIGNIEPLMANTGTGGVNSSGAAYYNPAALTQLKGTSFSLSGTALTRFNFNIDGAIQIGNEQLDYNGSGFQSIPTSMIIVKSIATWKVGFSILIPMKFKYEGPTNWKLESLGGSDIKIEQNYDEGQMLLGLSAAKSLNENWSVGISGSVQAYSILSIDQVRFSNVNRPSDVTVDNKRLQISPYNLVLVAGILYSKPKWSIGARITLPSIYLFGKGTYNEFIFIKIDSISNSSSIELQEQKAILKAPLDIRLGVKVIPKERWMFCSDISYGLSTSFNVFESAIYPNRTSQPDMFRSSLGSEFRLITNLFSYGGISYSTPLIDKGYEFMTGTLGLKMKTTNIESTVGAFYSWGGGKSLSLQNVTETYTTLGVFLGTNYVF